MSSKKLWFGFLEAGAKSSPVVADSKLNTGNDATMYLFNQVKDTVVEYRRDIVETKLRELRADEAHLEKELSAMYKKALAVFTPRGSSAAVIPERSAPPPAEKPVEDDIDTDDDSDMDEFDDDDDLAGEDD